MRIVITIKGGASSIEGEISSAESMEELAKALVVADSIILDKTPHGKVIVNKSAIAYITRKQ